METPVASPEVVLPALVVHRFGFGCCSSPVQPPSVLFDIWFHLNNGDFVLTMKHVLSSPGRLKEGKGTKQNFIFPGKHGQKLQARPPLEVVVSDDAKEEAAVALSVLDSESNCYCRIRGR